MWAGDGSVHVRILTATDTTEKISGSGFHLSLFNETPGRNYWRTGDEWGQGRRQGARMLSGFPGDGLPARVLRFSLKPRCENEGFRTGSGGGARIRLLRKQRPGRAKNYSGSEMTENVRFINAQTKTRTSLVAPVYFSWTSNPLRPIDVVDRAGRGWSR